MRVDRGEGGNWIDRAWPIEQVTISESDKQILRETAKEFKELCERPIEQEKIRLWTDHNDLKDTRPLILVDIEYGWNEALTFDKDIKCEGYMAQDWEMWLRKEIYWATKIKDDKPLTPVFYIPYKATNTEWGIEEEHMQAGDKSGAYTWEPVFSKLSPEEFENTDMETAIKDPIVEVDYETSNATMELAKEVFRDILEVEFRSKWWWSSHTVLAYAHYRGLEGLMFDFYDHPEKVHEMMKKFTDGHIKKLKYLEENNLLHNNVGNCFVGSGGLGFTDELKPVTGEVKLSQMWNLNEAQEASGLSPEMYREFIFPYHQQLAGLFGLNCHGCCEGVDIFWEDVKKTPNLRRVSVSQWADKQKMADYLGKDYVYSFKSSSTDVAMPNMDEDMVREKVVEILNIAKDNHLELVLKDLHTISHTPQQVWRWTEIAREEINRMYG